MKNKFLMVLFLLSTQTFLVNCAKSSDSNNANNVNGLCTTAGYVSTTQYGCVPGNTALQCQAGYVSTTQYGCVPGTVNNGLNSCQAGYVSTQYGCLPQSTGQCQVGYGYSPQYGCVPPTYNNGMNGGTCNGQVGYYQTIVGCLPQGVCPVNYGFYSGTSYNGQYSPTGFCFYRTQ